MSIRRQLLVALVAVGAFFVFTPEVRGSHCNASGCQEYAESAWGSPLPPGNLAFLPALVAGACCGRLTYRLVRPRPGW